MVGRPENAEGAPWFDPGWLIWRTMMVDAGDPPGAAEDALLAWLLRLPDGQDPAQAAGAVLRAYDPAGDSSTPLVRNLFVLLEQTRSYPRHRLEQMHGTPVQGGRRRAHGAKAAT